MKTEDQMSTILSFAEREKEKNVAAAALHVDQLEHQAESMEAQFAKELAIVEAAQKVVEVVVNKEIFVEVYVLPSGAPGGPPGWQLTRLPVASGANMDGRHGTVHRSFCGNNSVSKHAAMPECQG